MNKHVPALVVLIGMVCVVYAMSTFFYPVRERAPVIAPAVPRIAPVEEVRDVMIPDRPENRFQIPKFQTDAEVKKAVVESYKLPARKHLQSVALTMNLPDAYQYHEVLDGNIRVLMGIDANNSVPFYFFTVPGKYPAEQARLYMEDFFRDDLDLVVKSQSQTRTRSDFGTMTQFRGMTSRGDEFLGFFFYNPKTRLSHGLFITDKQLSRNPAKVRELVDSVKNSGS